MTTLPRSGSEPCHSGPDTELGRISIVAGRCGHDGNFGSGPLRVDIGPCKMETRSLPCDIEPAKELLHAEDGARKLVGETEQILVAGEQGIGLAS